MALPGPYPQGLGFSDILHTHPAPGQPGLAKTSQKPRGLLCLCCGSYSGGLGLAGGLWPFLASWESFSLRRLPSPPLLPIAPYIQSKGSPACALSSPTVCQVAWGNQD